MKFDPPLLRGTLIKRYKRFLADIRLDSGEIITAHCANSGSMMGLKDPGNVVWVNPATNPKRKLKYDWNLVNVGDAMVGINTSFPNAIIAAAIEADRFPELTGYANLKREVKYAASSRIDILLTDEQRPPCYVEIKNVTLARTPPVAEFPDAKTTRGTKHLHDLADEVRRGNRAVMFYLVQRDDCQTFTLASDIDPDYAAAFALAIDAGVEVLCYDCELSSSGIRIRNPIELKL